MDEAFLFKATYDAVNKYEQMQNLEEETHRCPDCGSENSVFNPLDNSKYICKDCGLNYGSE